MTVFKTHKDPGLGVPSWPTLCGESQLEELGFCFKDANCPFFRCILERNKREQKKAFIDRNEHINFKDNLKSNWSLQEANSSISIWP